LRNSPILGTSGLDTHFILAQTAAISNAERLWDLPPEQEIAVDAPHDDRRVDGRTPGVHPPSVIGFAGLLTLGVIPWVYLVHVLVIGELNTWAGHAAHVVRNSLAAFPIAVLALAISRRLAHRWGVGEASAADRLSLAALITLVFALCLLPVAVAHHFLDRWLDMDSPAGMFPGHRHPDGVVTATNILGRTVRGLRDVLVAVAAAFPVSLLGLAVPLRRRRPPPGLPRSEWAPGANLAVPVAGALVILGVGITAVSLSRTEVDPEHAPLARRPIVSVVPAGTGAQAGDLRLTPRTVKWIRHPHPPTLDARAAAQPAAAESHRLSVEFTVANLGAGIRTFGRKDIRLQAADGRAWSPVADGFPPIALGPQEAFTSMLVFAVPAPVPGLQIAWVHDGREVRIPIASDRHAPAAGTHDRRHTGP
jgi:hypothetical protein